MPHGALLGGYTVSGEPLFVARSTVDGEAVAGKVHGSHGCAYFPHGGGEHRKSSYEVLCFN